MQKTAVPSFLTNVIESYVINKIGNKQDTGLGEIHDDLFSAFSLLPRACASVRRGHWLTDHRSGFVTRQRQAIPVRQLVLDRGKAGLLADVGDNITNRYRIIRVGS